MIQLDVNINLNAYQIDNVEIPRRSRLRMPSDNPYDTLEIGVSPVSLSY